MCVCMCVCVRVCACMLQEVHSGRFAMYDYGEEENRKLYGVVSNEWVWLLWVGLRRPDLKTGYEISN